MENVEDIDFGPLKQLIGTWEGDKGLDVAPTENGEEQNLYYEILVFSPVGGVDNVETQELVVLHYRQVVKSKEDDKVIHDQTGYWMWDANAQQIMQSVVIPRGLSLLAGGTLEKHDADTTFKVYSSVDNQNWQISQSAFLQKNAKTVRYEHALTVGEKQLSYSQTSTLEIFGRRFAHTDKNVLTKV